MADLEPVEDEPVEEEPKRVIEIREVPPKLPRRLLDFFTGLPSLIPSIKRRRERTRWTRHLELRRNLWRSVQAEVSVPNKFKKVGKGERVRDEEHKHRVEAEIKRAEERCNADLSRIKARIDAIDLHSVAKQADKFGIPVLDKTFTDEENGEKYTPMTWIEFLDRCEAPLTNKERTQLRSDVRARLDERRKRRTETLMPFLTVIVQMLTAGAAKLPPAYNLLVRAHTLFKQVEEALEKGSQEEFLVPKFLLIRTHSAFLAGIRLAMSGQIVEAFPVYRSAIECTWYALYIAKDPKGTDRSEIWLKRNDDDQAKSRCKSEFTIANVRKTHEGLEPVTAKELHELYEKLIDYGAHVPEL